MKATSKSHTTRHQNGPTCLVLEYGGNRDIDGAVAEINGRYPQDGWAKNTVSTEQVFVISGSGSIVTKNVTKTLGQEDTLLIEPNEPYFIEGDNLRIFISCSPAWSPDQYEIENGTSK